MQLWGMSAKNSPIFQYRQTKGLTQAQFGAPLGVSKATVLRWEEGRIRIPADRVVEIERHTGIPRESLRPDLYADKGTAPNESAA
jgi:DNA-binding transcriptional regulator YdaS (Cro superfamily)